MSPSNFGSEPQSALPYYVCTYHSGITVEEFVRRKLKLGVNESFYAISSLLSVLEYLHLQGRRHCDLHTKNVMIDVDIFRHGLLVIDFGSGHRDSDSKPAYAKPWNPVRKGHTRQGPLPARRIPSGNEYRLSKCGLSRFGTPARNAGRKLLHGMLDGSGESVRRFFVTLPTSGMIQDWAHARGELQAVMDPMRKLTLLNRLFEDSRGRQRQVIQLPVSRMVLVGEKPLAVINMPTFQNLRRLMQLSFCEWRFPGATHTRFEHSLGVFSLVRRAVSSLCSDIRFRDQFTVDDMKGCLLAGLLHDVGHYPFAHVIEQFAGGGRFWGTLLDWRRRSSYQPINRSN